jgi:hypothetical protein
MGQPHQKARTMQDHLKCQTEYYLSVSHKIGASPPNLPKKQKTKSIPQNHQKSYFWSIPTQLAKKTKLKLVPQNHQKSYFWRIPTQLAKKTKKKQSRFHRIIRKAISGASPPNLPKKKKQSRFHRIIRKTISGASPPNLTKKQKKTKSIPKNHQKNYFCGT